MILSFTHYGINVFYNPKNNIKRKVNLGKHQPKNAMVVVAHADDAEYDLRNESLDSIRQMIDNERLRREDIHNINQEDQPIWDPLTVTHEDGNLTPEELTIRWAVERGRTINI